MIVPIVPIVPHRSKWLIYAVFGGTVPLAGHRPPHRPPHRPLLMGDGQGTVKGTVKSEAIVPPLFGLPMRVSLCYSTRGTVGTVECGTLHANFR
jgi:hypothetical protein